MFAARAGHAKAIEMLRIAGGRAHRKSETKRKCRRGPRGSFQAPFVLDPGLVHLAAASDKGKGALQALLEYEEFADIDALHGGMTPLAVAVAEGATENVKLLLEIGGDPAFRRRDTGVTLVHLAAEAGSTGSLEAVLKVLPKHFVDEPDTPVTNWAPLHSAAEHGHPEVIEALLRRGAKMVVVDRHGTTALHLAALGGHDQCIDLLLQWKHPVDLVDNAGWPPLLYANFQSNEQSVLSLLRAKPEHLQVLHTVPPIQLIHCSFGIS